MNETISFLTQHEALLLFAVILAEQVGLPLPAFPFLIAAGALVGFGQISLGLAVVSAVLGALVGDLLWFELGHCHGRRVLNWLGRFSREIASLVLRTEKFFARYGLRSLLVVKFVPGLGLIVGPLAGTIGLARPQYLLYTSFGTILWVTSGIGIGYAFSGQLEQAITVASHVGPPVGLILLGGGTGYAVYKALHRYRLARPLSPFTQAEVPRVSDRNPFPA